MDENANGYTRVKAEDLKQMVIDVIQCYGVSAEHANIVGDVLVAADLRGVESHGVSRLNSYYVSRLKQGRTNPRPDMKIVREFGTTFVLDCDNGLGHPAGHMAMNKCIELAKQHGLAMGGIRNSNHYGIAGYYSMMALEEDMIGFSICNTVPYVMPTYSRKRLLGTNPISVAVPAKNREPFVLDMATSVVPMGKIQMQNRKGLPIRPEWGADDQGVATTDPAKVIGGGGLFPLGGPAETAGYKGYGLAAAVDIFSGLLTGSTFLSAVLATLDNPDPCMIGHLMAAIKVDAFMDRDEFTEKMDQFIDELKNAPLAAGCEEIFVAGEKEFRAWEQNTREGIKIYEKVWDELAALCTENKVKLPDPVK